MNAITIFLCHLQVLVVGGGDGGVVREVLKYESLKEVVLCEIDEVCLFLIFTGTVVITFLSLYPLYVQKTLFFRYDSNIV